MGDAELWIIRAVKNRPYKLLSDLDDVASG